MVQSWNEYIRDNWDNCIKKAQKMHEIFSKIPSTEEIIINKIQESRFRNNKNWMDILRLAFKYAPDEAKKIMMDITECDAEINRLSKKLSEE